MKKNQPMTIGSPAGNPILKRISLALVLLVLALALCSCRANASEAVELLFAGDIIGGALKIDITDSEKEDFIYQKDGEGVTAEGYRLSNILKAVTPISGESWLLIVGVDGTAARIEIDTASLCFLLCEDGIISVKAPSHPPVVGIKNVSEIVIIAKGDVADGIKLVKQNSAESLSFGQARLLFFEQKAENRKDDVCAFKHIERAETKISALTDEHMNIVYLNNFDIIKSNNDEGRLCWQDGELGYEIGGKKYLGIKGVVSGTEMLIYDAYNLLKDAIDNDERVMFILPDGLSLQQVKTFKEELSLFADGYLPSASVDPAISNVALAALVTGESPFYTGITERCVKKPSVQDIFEYAESRNKTVSYIEGNGNLIITSVEPTFNSLDADGFSDENVYNSAKSKLASSPDLIFIHFHGIDDVNHKSGPLSEDAKSKILEVEAFIEDLIDGFDGKVVIVPDHGAVTVDNNGKTEGKHGVFSNHDMFVPFYVIERRA